MTVGLAEDQIIVDVLGSEQSRVAILLCVVLLLQETLQRTNYGRH
jgi:hypothetical protein